MAKKFDLAELPALPDLRYERELWTAGCLHPAGLDEAGRGAWAGPVTAGAVILPVDEGIASRLNQVRDSKQMQPKQRVHWEAVIKAAAVAWGVGFATNEEIDQYNIVGATRLAMQRALQALCVEPDHLLIDALRLPKIDLPQTCLIKGDARSLSIAAASVLAKTARDRLMCELDAAYPEYGFAQHKGYGTESHRSALHSAGPCPIHRFSFEPVKLKLLDI